MALNILFLVGGLILGLFIKEFFPTDMLHL